jgi:hypothetical protein
MVCACTYPVREYFFARGHFSRCCTILNIVNDYEDYHVQTSFFLVPDPGKDITWSVPVLTPCENTSSPEVTFHGRCIPRRREMSAARVPPTVPLESPWPLPSLSLALSEVGAIRV